MSIVYKNLAILAFASTLSLTGLAQVIISEVYSNAPGRQTDKGQEWFEIYNIGDEEIELGGAIIRRLDGQKLNEAWKLQLPASSLALAPKQYAIIAQKIDLGIGVCLSTPTLIIDNNNFSFKNSGIQNLCIQVKDTEEKCTRISNNDKFPDGSSYYNMASELYLPEERIILKISDCEIAPNTFASPGVDSGFCHNNSYLLPNLVKCKSDPAKLETAAVDDLTIENSTNKPQNQEQVPSCYCSKTSATPNLIFPALIIFCTFTFIIRPKADASK